MTGIAVSGFIVSRFAGAGDEASPSAFLSTAGTSSTAEPSGTLTNSGQPAAPAAGQRLKRRHWWPRGFVPNALIALAAVGFLTGACLDACTQMNTIRRVPAIHGRVVDMATGQPLAGVRVTRWFERDMIVGPGGSDTYRVKGSLRTVTSDATGHFEFPSWYGIGRGINAVQWTEFKPGWAAGWGHLVLANPPRFGVARRNSTYESVQTETRRNGSALTATLTLHRVDSPTVAEDHFWALRILVEGRVIPEEEFVKEAVAYVGPHEVSPDVLDEISMVESRLGGHDGDNRPCYKAGLAFDLQTLREQICGQHPDWRACNQTSLAWRRSFLERECRLFRR